MENERILLLVERSEEGYPLDVIPVVVAQENLGANRTLAEFPAERVTEETNPRAAVENQDLPACAHLNARSIPAIAKILADRGWRGTSNAPESQKY